MAKETTQSNFELGSLSNEQSKSGRFFRKLPRPVGIILLVLILLLIGARIALSFAVRDYVNRQLSKIPEYSGHVQKVQISLYRGAYTILDARLVKTNSDVPVPFISLPQMDLAVDWSELFHGSVVDRIIVDRPEVNFTTGPSEKQQQTGMHKDWKKTVESLFPLTINRFQVNDGTFHYRDDYREPKVNIYVTNLFATATNLTNTKDATTQLPAGLLARGKTIGNGTLHIDLLMNPLADTPTFKLNASVTNLDLVALNDFMRAYGNFDVAKGTFALYTEFAAADGRYEGYIKPFFFDLQIFDRQKERKKNILRIFWEAIMAGVSHILRNQPHDQLATTIPISGNFERGSNVDIWGTIGGILKNAFVRALLPKIDRSVDLERLRKKGSYQRGSQRP